MVLIVLSLAWVTGVWLGSQLMPSPLWFIAAIFPMLFALVKRWRARAVLAAAAILIFAGGALYFHSSFSGTGGNNVASFIDGSAHTFEGTVSRMPEAREKSQALRLSGISVLIDGECRAVTGAVMVYVTPFPEYDYGDRITVTGMLLEPPVFDTFDWRAYLARDEVFATVLYPSVTAVSPGHGNPMLAGIYDLRQRLADNIAAALPEPHASLAQGLALGIRSGIPDEVNQAFSASGTSHLLAVSGQNLAIVAAVLLFAIRGLIGRRGYWYVWLAMAAVWVFTILSGLASPVVRGAIMASIFVLAELLGRQKAAAPALCFAAALMVAANPQLLWSASFQMSFAAMAGLIFLLPPLDRFTRQAALKFPGKSSRFYGVFRWVAEGLAVSFAAVAGVLPLIAYYFGNISLSGGVATLAAAPALPLIIFGGLLTGIAAVIQPVLAIPFGAITWLGLSYLLAAVEFFARIPPIQVESFHPLFIWLSYAVLAAFAWWLWRWERRQSFEDHARPVKLGRFVSLGIPAITLITVLVSTILNFPVDHRLQVTFLDVGQGDAIYIRTPAGQDILIDGGPSPQRLTQELSRRMPFWDRTIELVVSTHADADHLTGLVEALNRYKIIQIVDSGIPADTDLYGEWRRLIDEKKVPDTAVSAGQRIRLAGGLELEVFNPYDDTIADTNASCLVLGLKYGETSFLFTGDLPQSSELELVYRRLLPDATVLKVAHHGSNGSTGAAFLAVAPPELAIIQVGRNSYGHPTSAVVSALDSICIENGVFRTDTSGSVSFITDGHTLWRKK
ncbi:competence protein ComEC [Dehalogenimonas formicexedens]|uniref:Competence protein ComEC n=1 Tax=Dehalogenimonas formicexedens TaxID=1839801 RepID=A0A1P8F4L0_9CHLR|nr:DNA internalization-related competence protein ComEC/Rec2 [Dehalogenimonas formicexedens]APV43414.1 competence protein ComEC [Dehalogenimonas formicexedens]